MKTMKTVAVVVLSVCLGFFAGRYVSESEQNQADEQRCQQMISFAVAKTESLRKQYDSDTMEALISNVYAAYEYADRSGELSGALHDLWNALVFDGENIAGKEDDLIDAMEELDAQCIREIAMGMRTKG